MNKSILNLHLEILDSNRQELLEKLSSFAKGFILGGGTALALQLKHRKSFDFDFFSQSPIEKSFLEQLSRTISIGNISYDTPNELTFFTKDEIKITFLHYPFPHVLPIERLENGLRLFSVNDIAVKKAYTIGRRGEYRDYFDLYSIFIDKYISLSELISFSKKTYGSLFEEKIFLQQLVYFEDLLNFEIIPIDKPLPQPEEVKVFFEDLVKNYINKPSQP